MPRLVFGVVLARCHQHAAGHTCAIMNWAAGFREAGWDVWITEHLDAKELIPDPRHPGQSLQETFWKETVAEFGFLGRECLLIDGAAPALAAMREFSGGADLFLNYSGQFHRLDLMQGVRRRAYLDVDPAFTQIWAERFGADMNLAGHDCHFTVGLNINGPDALLPRAGVEWIPTPPPLPAAFWRHRFGAAAPAPGAPWTTVGRWYGFADLPWNGRISGGKRENFVPLAPLPREAGVPCAVATDLLPGWNERDHETFTAEGWRIASAAEVCRDVPSYLRFIGQSRGEIGVAKSGYVASRCGWISDRSLVYLALGRPVLLQDTGWIRAFDGGEGMLPFHDLASCAAAVRRIESDYDRHARAARNLAETRFAPASIVASLAREAGL
jgi:hypothetical protein